MEGFGRSAQQPDAPIPSGGPRGGAVPGGVQRQLDQDHGRGPERRDVLCPPLEAVGDLDAHLFIASPAGGAESMHLMYLMAVAAATESVDLAAACFVPDGLLADALVAALLRGVRIRLLLPGPHTCPALEDLYDENNLAA